MLQNDGYFGDDLVNTFTMVGGTFEFQSSKLLQNEICSSVDLVNTFTVIEENLEFQSPEMLQNNGFS